MPGFDTSNVAAEVNAPPNMMQQFGQMAQTINALNQNKMFQAKQLAAGYMEQATGPDGQVDPGKLNQFLLADPRTRAAAPEIEQLALGNQGQSISNTTNTQALRTKYMGTLQGLIAQTTEDSQVPGVVARAVASGLIPADFGAEALGGNVQGLDMPSIHQARSQAILAASNATEAQANLGTPSQVNLGGNLTTLNTTVGPEGANVTQAGGPAAVVPLGIAPAQANTEAYKYFDPDSKQMVTVTQAQAAAARNAGQPLPGSINGKINAGPALGVEAAANTAAAANVNQGMALQTQAAGAPQRIALLKNMHDEAGQFASGPQSGFWKGLNTLLGAYGGSVTIPDKIGGDAAASQEEFDKLSTQVLGSQRAAMGLPVTDASTQITQGATPNEKMTPKGIQRVIGLLRGNEDYIVAQNQAWQRYQAANGPQSYGEFVTKFNQRYDPRVFQAPYMAPDQRNVMEKGMSAAERKLFDARVKDAQTRGLINAQP